MGSQEVTYSRLPPGWVTLGASPKKRFRNRLPCCTGHSRRTPRRCDAIAENCLSEARAPSNRPEPWIPDMLG